MDQTSGVQLHTEGISRFHNVQLHIGFDASHRPGMTRYFFQSTILSLSPSNSMLQNVPP
jgi:hypothetical protein